MFQKTYEKQLFLDQQTLKDLLIYDNETGVFTWKKARIGITVGKVAGTIKPTGYIVILINKRLYRAHRLAWLYMTGNWPKHEIDHINGNRMDNRFCNLREATKAENNWNRKIRSDSKTGFKNVLSYPWGKFYVRIVANKKTYTFGPYSDKEQAVKIAEQKRKEIHGSFHNCHASPSISNSQSACSG
jgi:hypothetical protein